MAIHEVARSLPWFIALVRCTTTLDSLFSDVNWNPAPRSTAVGPYKEHGVRTEILQCLLVDRFGIAVNTVREGGITEGDEHMEGEECAVETGQQ